MQIPIKPLPRFFIEGRLRNFNVVPETDESGAILVSPEAIHQLFQIDTTCHFRLEFDAENKLARMVAVTPDQDEVEIGRVA
jgi:hypothetical protein